MKHFKRGRPHNRRNDQGKRKVRKTEAEKQAELFQKNKKTGTAAPAARCKKIQTYRKDTKGKPGTPKLLDSSYYIEALEVNKHAET